MVRLDRFVVLSGIKMIVCDYVGVQQVVVWVFSSLRQQRRHHHTSYAGSPKGIDGDVSSGSCQVLL